MPLKLVMYGFSLINQINYEYKHFFRGGNSHVLLFTFTCNYFFFTNSKIFTQQLFNSVINIIIEIKIWVDSRKMA